MPNDSDDLTKFRFDTLEKSHQEILTTLNKQSTNQAVMDTRLSTIESLLKWTLGGILAAIVMAIGRFIVSGKLMS